ncbi:MAG: gliding motility lipoprotein GldH [Runella slithyformis]|jgi:gliding motility-associated lipoprotein GldH|nr:MAG: gliding motility lipoprotein GldH [Runella slithyformis]TAE97688.1 MAG: gliding motility lipoprotein GldH [Runella slithyformis]TAF24414.1 MAG: gliding motility lipoprotein GldH [Runella slithyformis]TAF49373.1 MAG: gliding motility lipoprotein GldH [Runella slithyformis]TAF79203.1 MAG: gliding motility lipoprotein GldH [Runella slithyformis]
MKNKNYVASLVAFCCIFSLLSCDPNVHYKNHEDLDDGQWFVKNEPTFSFEIPDSTQNYNVYYLVRNASGYPYYNLYVKRFLLNSEKKTVNEALNELILMDEKTGKPLGSGLGDLFDHKIIALKNYRFPRKGKYTFKVRQYMRQDPLLGILSLGVSVEKVSKNKI